MPVPVMDADLIAVQLVPPSHDSSTHRFEVPPLLLIDTSARTVIPSIDVTLEGRPVEKPHHTCRSLAVLVHDGLRRLVPVFVSVATPPPDPQAFAGVLS